MRNNINSLVTSQVIALIREKGADPEPLLECLEHPPALLREAGRFVPNESLILLFAQARQVLGDPEAARLAGERTAAAVFDLALRRSLGLTPAAGVLEHVVQHYLPSLFLNVGVKTRVETPAELWVKVEKKSDYLHTHDHCLFIGGFLSGLVRLAGGELVEAGETRCMVPVDRAGDIKGCRYRIDDEGWIFRLEKGGAEGVALEEEVGRVREDFSHEVEGTVYGDRCCAYRVVFRDPRPWPTRIWGATFGRAAQFGRTVVSLERRGLAEAKEYPRITEEWARWLRWEPSWPLTRSKYLSYFGLLLMTGITAAVNLSAGNYSRRFGLEPLALLSIPAIGYLAVRGHLLQSRRILKLREDSEKFINSAKMGIVTLRPDFTIEYANPRVVELHGQVLGRKCHEVFKWESHACPDCPLAEAFISGQPMEAEREYLDQDGQTRWFHLTATPLLDDEGKVGSLISISTDITERKRLELELARHRAELQTSESRYRSFMAHAADAILISGPDHQILEVNLAACHLVKIKDFTPLLGKDLFESGLFPIEERLRLRGLFQRMVADRRHRSFETRLVDAEGREIEVEVRAIPILQDGEVAWVQSIFRDITERKQEEFEKSLLLSMSQAIKDAADLDTMVKLGLEGLCAVMNAPIGALFLRQADKPSLVLAHQVGISARAVQKLATAVADVSADDVASRAAILKRSLVIDNIAFNRMDEETRKFFQLTGVASVASVPMLEEDRLAGIIYLAARDVNYFNPRRLAVLRQAADEFAIGLSRQRLHDLLQEKNRELLQKNQELKTTTLQLFQSEKMASIGQLAAGVAHEINNPIGYINSNLGLLRTYREDIIEIFGAYQQLARAVERGADPNALHSLLRRVREVEAEKNPWQLLDDMKDMISESIEGSERVTTIVRNLKDFSHPEGGEAKPLDLHDCLESTLKIVWNELKYKAEVIKEYDDDVPVIKGYPQELKQVFMNLLVNAAQAIESRGEIRIRTRRTDRGAAVEIHDTGIGISKEQLPRIFDPFYTTKDVGTGTGLGLSISYSIVKKHGGEIVVKSEPGKGSTFTVRLPLEAPPAKEETKIIPPASFQPDSTSAPLN